MHITKKANERTMDEQDQTRKKHHTQHTEIMNKKKQRKNETNRDILFFHNVYLTRRWII